MKAHAVLKVLVAASFVAVVGCGGSHPPPTQPLADAQAADRSAQELGANAVPAARLHLKLAQEQMLKAKQLMENGDNERAEALLVRAKADAELAVSLAREVKAKGDIEQSVEKQNMKNGAVNQGAGQ